MIQIEKDFLKAMEQVYSKVAKESPQFKSFRVIFYMGAFNMVLSKEMGGTEEQLRKSVYEVKDALKFSSRMAQEGFHPEDALADYVKSDL